MFRAIQSMGERPVVYRGLLFTKAAPGTYELWISSVKTMGSEDVAYDVTARANARCGLPTNSSICRPLLITVHATPEQAETNLNDIFGALVGAVAAACICLLLFYLKAHPQKAMKANSPTAASLVCIDSYLSMHAFVHHECNLVLLTALYEFHVRRVQTGDAGPCDSVHVSIMPIHSAERYCSSRGISLVKRSIKRKRK